MKVVGYSDRFSVQPGQKIQFMVSCELPRYRAEIVRLIHGDTNPKGPGFKEELVKTPISREYTGRVQLFPRGSYVLVPDHRLLRQIESFTIQAWIYPTTPRKGPQGVVTKWSASDETGYGLFIDERGAMSLRIGSRDKLSSARPLRPSTWYFVAASYDGTTGEARLHQEAVTEWPLDESSSCVVEKSMSKNILGEGNSPLLIAAWHGRGESGNTTAGGHYNGKIDGPKLFSLALTRKEVDSLKKKNNALGKLRPHLVASWDFSIGFPSVKVTDTSRNKLHGRAINMPAKAVTGHNWTGRKVNHNESPEEYGAIHFHDDDLEDAAWGVDFVLDVPEGMKSGIYAARLQAGGDGEDYVPFFVRPRKGKPTAKIALLLPTLSYLAYGDIHVFKDALAASEYSLGLPKDFKYPVTEADKYIVENKLTSLYDTHTDGGGCFYATRLKPIPDMRPKYLEPVIGTGHGAGYPHQLNADLCLVDWLEAKGFQYNVITDEDLHHEGVRLLAPYRVVLTGSHPEYWTEQMLDGLTAYLRGGGRLMYLGGNGFYWVVSFHPERPHVIELRRQGGTSPWRAPMGECYHSTTGEPGGTWRTRGRFPNRLVGVGWTTSLEGFDVNRPYRRQKGSFDPRASFIFEGIGKDEPIGDFDSLVLEHGAAGFEQDRMDLELGTPPHTLLLASATGYSDEYQRCIEEITSANSKQGGTQDPKVRADMTYLEYPKGGAVFSASAITWTACLFYNNYDNNVSRITENVLKRFISAKKSQDNDDPRKGFRGNRQRVVRPGRREKSSK